MHGGAACWLGITSDIRPLPNLTSNVPAGSAAVVHSSARSTQSAVHAPCWRLMSRHEMTADNSITPLSMDAAQADDRSDVQLELRHSSWLW